MKKWLIEKAILALKKMMLDKLWEWIKKQWMKFYNKLTENIR